MCCPPPHLLLLDAAGYTPTDCIDEILSEYCSSTHPADFSVYTVQTAENVQ